MPLLDNPHHDGSPVYVRLSDASQEVPALGSVVALRMATKPADPIDAVWIRTTYDAEPTFHPCTGDVDGSWTDAIPVHNRSPLPVPDRAR